MLESDLTWPLLIGLILLVGAFFVVARKSSFDNWFMVLIALLSSYICAREVTKHCSILTLPCVPIFPYKIALCSLVPTVFSLFVPCLTYFLAIFPYHRHPPQRKFVEVYLFLRSRRQFHIKLFPTIFLLCSLCSPNPLGDPQSFFRRPKALIGHFGNMKYSAW